MPTQTMEPATEGQKAKIARKLNHFFRYPDFQELRFDLLTQELDREIAQWIIESRHIPTLFEWRKFPPTTSVALEHSIDFFKTLRNCVNLALGSSETIEIYADVRHLSIWPLRGEGVSCNKIKVHGSTFYGPQVFRAVNADGGLAQMVSEYYSADPSHDKTLRHGNRATSDEQRQIITDLLPFAKVQWYEFMCDECVGEYLCVKSPDPVDIENVRLHCAPARSARRNSRNHTRRALKRIPWVSRPWHPGILD